MELAEKLKELRERKGLKVSECATQIGVSTSTYRDWEYGRSITGQPYKKIASVLGVSLSELFGSGEEALSGQLRKLENDLSIMLDHVKNIRSGL